MRVTLLSAAVSMLLMSTALAQRAEVFGDYSYMQFNPTLSGLQSRAFNGGGGGFQYNVLPYLGIKGEFQGYGSTEWTANVTSPISTPGGIIPIGTYTTRANMFTYLFGPVARVPMHKINVFGETLFGGSNSSGYANLYNQALAANTSYNPNQHPFTMAVGGGLDFNLNHRVSFRLGEMDWMLTRYTNPFTNTNNQNSFRYVGGVVVKLGGE
jgi:hypothetical protein